MPTTAKDAGSGPRAHANANVGAWPRHPSDGLGRTQGRVVVAVICALHAVAGWALLQVPAVRAAVAEVAPVFVSLVAPQTPAEPPPPPPPALRPPPTRMPLPARTVALAPSPVAAPFAVPPPEPVPDPSPEPEPPAPAVVVQAPPVPAPALPPPPKLIPASAVQYLDAPVLEYPRASRRAGESGSVLVRVYIDEAGLPRTVLVGRSSGHARLDQAALDAVRGARFKPYTENAQPTAGWAVVPLIFDLEN